MKKQYLYITNLKKLRRKKKQQNRKQNRLYEINNSVCGINNLTSGKINK
jgi:hypothetical protein